MLRACLWDHATLPYKPPSPCILFYLVPGDPVWRVSVPNARGEYPDLIPGLPYKEWHAIEPHYLQEYASPALSIHRSAEVAWEDLPTPPFDDFKRFLSPSENTVAK
ncbi:hypothetical protein GH5_03450 [Leishmania sp. Ghana 2012 LV757]|uniref:hypothetical protein n=1 Tax=Leishmania sp. Ghana 2012 LV757 TaxID=2803181 RepID=UPI001B54A481|nr:hypothetical protein GH5_03450 [Leishmania sp. Ghana 2012 LV757]